MSENQTEQETVYRVTDTVRTVAAEYAKRRRLPAVAQQRILNGGADLEPMQQAFAKLYWLNQKQIDQLTKDNHELTTALNDESKRVSFYSKTLNDIIRRAKGSIFGKGKDIIRQAQSAINTIEGDYH